MSHIERVLSRASHPLILGAIDDVVLYPFIKFNKEGAVSRDPDDQPPVCIWVFLGCTQRIGGDDIELNMPSSKVKEGFDQSSHTPFSFCVR